MYTRFLCYFGLAISFTLHSSENVQRSITGNITSYLEACLRAVDDPTYFQNFRSSPEYAPILECGFEGESSQYLLQNATPTTLKTLDSFRELEQYGGPGTSNIPGFGRFSGTTLRYIVIADQITRLFELPSSCKIAEIGAGFGGQCYILSRLVPFSDYFIYDLPQVELLIGKMMRTLSVNNVHLMPARADLPEEKIDLVVSNYAFSECDRKTQLSYFERVLKKADRGYILFNQLHCFDSLTPEELVQMLANAQMNPEVHPEPIFTYQDNLLITWDRNKSNLD